MAWFFFYHWVMLYVISWGFVHQIRLNLGRNIESGLVHIFELTVLSAFLPLDLWIQQEKGKPLQALLHVYILCIGTVNSWILHQIPVLPNQGFCFLYCKMFHPDCVLVLTERLCLGLNRNILRGFKIKFLCMLKCLFP